MNKHNIPDLQKYLRFFYIRPAISLDSMDAFGELFDFEVDTSTRTWFHAVKEISPDYSIVVDCTWECGIAYIQLYLQVAKWDYYKTEILEYVKVLTLATFRKG